jgi:hypothetical protein
MSELKKYSKAIAAAVAGVIATVIAVVRGEDAESIPGTVEIITAVITTIIVYLIPNKSD